MGIADRYADGSWNFYCDLCGRKNKASDAEKTWDNHYVCRHHKEVRNPQDFVKGVRDRQAPPWIRAEPPDTFITFCTLQGTVAGPGYGVPGCMIPGKTSPLYPLVANPAGSTTAIPADAIPGNALPGNLS